MMYCPKCGEQILDDSIFCSKCGSKINNSIVLVNNENEVREYDMKVSKTKNIIFGFIGVIILFLIAGGGSYLYFNKIEAKKYETYCQNYAVNFIHATKDILIEEKATSLMCSLISETWSSAIDSHYKDFNTELYELKQQWVNDGNLKSREDAKSKIELEMSQLKNPPDDYKEAYNVLVELYGYYTQIYNQSVSPKGSLITYNQDVNNKTGEFDKVYDKLAIIKPDIKSIDSNKIKDSNVNVTKLKANISENKGKLINNSKDITSNEATEIVKRFLKNINADTIIEYDHTENINGIEYYSVHVYSIVNGHTATVGWYYVDTNTGEAYKWGADNTLTNLS